MFGCQFYKKQSFVLVQQGWQYNVSACLHGEASWNGCSIAAPTAVVLISEKELFLHFKEE